ncbi:MAG: IS3 family transposase [Mycobacteriales bacterium]
MSGSQPRAGGPSRRRTFAPAEKLQHLAAYDQACRDGQGGAYLRREGLYSSQVTEWRKLRDAGVLDGKPPGARGGKLSVEQAELARLRAELERAEHRLARTEVALDIMGKAHALLEEISESGAGRAAAQAALMLAFRALTKAGVTTRDAAHLTGVSRATAGRLPRRGTVSALRSVPANRLTALERAEVLAVLNSVEFVDRTPLQIYAVLLDRGRYLCSVSSMYRILAEHAQVKDRRRLARHPAQVRPELVATGPGQVFTWDITRLRGPLKGSYFDAYVMIDIYSRYIVGACVHVTETAVLAEEMMKEVFTIHGTPRVVHADRGTSMTSKTVAALLTDLGVTRSHSRPRVSNDNPFSEAWFKTLKYAPVFPDRFGSLQHARAFLDEFVQHYNHEHRHIGIGLHTPADVHYGLAADTGQRRRDTLAAARTASPNRFTSNTDPKILDLPEAAWINPPIPQPDHQEQETVTAAA